MMNARFGKKILLHAVDRVSFTLARGEALGLVGESGCGKTTLGRLILRLLEPDSGSVLYERAEISRKNIGQFRSRMQIIYQNPERSLDPRMQIHDIVAEGMKHNQKGIAKGECRKQVQEILNMVGLRSEDALLYPHELSGGQQQRVGIARALAVDPEFIVCDEPVSSLDVSYQSQIINLLEDLQKKKGLSYLFISHDLSVVRHISDRIGVMYLGRFIETGPTDEVILHPAHPYTKSLLAAIPVPDPEHYRTKRNGEEPELIQARDNDTAGCLYYNSCRFAKAICGSSKPDSKEIAPGRQCACHLY